MIKQIIICDNCKKEIKDNNEVRVEINTNDCEYDHCLFDLCKECKEKFYKQIDNMLLKEA